MCGLKIIVEGREKDEGWREGKMERGREKVRDERKKKRNCIKKIFKKNRENLLVNKNKIRKSE